MGQPYQKYQGPDAHGVIIKIAPDIIAYVDWYAEHGIYLPTEFARDPAAWTQILRDIQAGVRELLKDEGVDEKLLYDGIAKYYQYIEHLFKNP